MRLPCVPFMKTLLVAEDLKNADLIPLFGMQQENAGSLRAASFPEFFLSDDASNCSSTQLRNVVEHHLPYLSRLEEEGVRS